MQVLLHRCSADLLCSETEIDMHKGSQKHAHGKVASGVISPQEGAMNAHMSAAEDFSDLEVEVVEVERWSRCVIST